MKFFAAIAVAIAAVNAAAVPEAEPNAQAFCDSVGMPCWVAKRAAEAFAEAIADDTAEPLSARHAEAIPFCMKDGSPCDVAKRDVEEIATVLARSMDDSFIDGLSLERRYADPQTSCYRVGRPCHKKRSAEPAPEPQTSCYRVGRPCHKKRMAEANAFCSSAGRPCNKTKRAAEAVLEVVKREPEANPQTSCYRVGRPCHKKRDAELMRRCSEEGQPCYLAQRDLDEAVNVARDVLEEQG